MWPGNGDYKTERAKLRDRRPRLTDKSLNSEHEGFIAYQLMLLSNYLQSTTQHMEQHIG